MRNGWARLGGVLGIVYCLVGFLLVFLGWNGAASYDRVSAQIPYVVSGGLGGLGLIVLGSALIVAQSLRAGRVDGSVDERRQPVERATTEAGRPLATTATTTADETVVAGPTSYHRATCRVIEDQAGAVTMTRTEAATSGRTPCRVCDPDGRGLTA